MNRELKIFYSHLNAAATILQLYDGGIPFAHFVKNYFSQHKKFGSKDRKQISELCYAYFRLGKAYLNVPVADRLLLALKYGAESIDAKWQQVIDASELPDEQPKQIFPWKKELSEPMDAAAFEASFSKQPDLFLRIRPGFENAVLKKTESVDFKFSRDGNSIRLPNSAKAGELFTINKEVVIQDLSSQKTALFLERVRRSFPPGHSISVYDCCAASGGKSILAKDILGEIDLTVSDSRSTILTQLHNRFRDAGIFKYQSFVQDLTKKIRLQEKYDLVIADVPCTGSGTWARTPEQLYFFDKHKINEFASLQKSIIQTIVEAIKPGGLLLYITCSVFQKENEEQVREITAKGFDPVLIKTIEGYKEKADTMFGALLRKSEG